jgi:hypothetical protein
MYHLIKKWERVALYILPLLIVFIVDFYYKEAVIDFFILGYTSYFDDLKFYAYFNSTLLIMLELLFISILNKIRKSRLLALDLPILYQKNAYIIYGDQDRILIKDTLYTFDEVEKWRDASHYTVEVTINKKEYDWKFNYELYQFIMKNLKEKGIYQHQLRCIKKSNIH